MKKEQLLLVVALVIGALLVLANQGSYEPVGATSIPAGKDVQIAATVPADPLRGIPADSPVGRAFVRQHRTEKRKEAPKLEAPQPSGLPWVRPVPTPGLGPAHWGPLREPMTTVPRATAKGADDSGAAPPSEEEEEDPEKVAARQAEEDRRKKEEEDRKRVADAAQLVLRDGSSKPCRLAPTGDLEGQPVWSILERWPNVRFRVTELNAQHARTEVGTYDIDDKSIERYLTVHLEKTLENEYHEERIRRGLREGDREAQISFSKWIRENLGPRYGIPALRMAAPHLRAAAAIAMDVPLALLVGEFWRDAYDLENEVRTYQEYLASPTRANDGAILTALGDALERGGAVHAARDAFAKAAAAGDVEGRLRLGDVLVRLADSPAALRAAHDEFAKAQSAASPADRARALAGMARARLAEGRVDDALALAKQAKQTDGTTWAVHATLGSCHYVKGQFAEAEAAYATAAPFETRRGTRARTDRAFALLALDRLADAVAECDAAAKEDPLNFLDPLVGAGEAHQRWNDLTRSNDIFQTALRRHPTNAWVLLRLAAIRLRDGLPQQAMTLLQGGEGTTGLLQVAPESVDGLRLAGLVSATLEGDEAANAAVRFLRRALQKEPKNPDLVYDLGRVLHETGRSAEALALLRRATDAVQGPAKNDARVLALLAFVEFDSAQPLDTVLETLTRAQRSVHSAWTKPYVEGLRDAIVRWDRTRIWLDEFERSQQDVGNGWKEDEARLKVGLRVDGKNAVFSSDRTGATAAENRAGTRLYREDLDLATFVEAEVTLRAEAGFEFVVHLWSGDLAVKGAKGGRGQRGVEVGFGRTRDGRMCLWVYGGSGDKMLEVPVVDEQGQERRWPEDGAFHTVRIRRTDPKEGRFSLELDGEPVPVPEPVIVNTLSKRNAKCMFGIHVDADTGSQVLLEVDRVMIEKTEGL